MYPGFNMRSNEINAFIGLEQLKRLNKNVQQRKELSNFFRSHRLKKNFLLNLNLKVILTTLFH